MMKQFVVLCFTLVVQWCNAQSDVVSETPKVTITNVDFTLKRRDTTHKSAFKLVFDSSADFTYATVNDTQYLSYNAKFHDVNGPIKTKFRHVAVLLEAENPESLPLGFDRTHTIVMDYTESGGDSLPYRCNQYFNDSRRIAEGVYKVNIIVGDNKALVEPFMDSIDKLKIKVESTTDAVTVLVDGEHARVSNVVSSWYAKIPIKHTFQQPPPRSAPLVTLVFLLLIALAFPTHVYTLLKIGSNIDYFSLTITNVLFSICLVGCAIVLIVYWVALNLPTALALLLPLGLVTAVFGNMALNESRERSVVCEAKSKKTE